MAAAWVARAGDADDAGRDVRRAVRRESMRADVGAQRVDVVAEALAVADDADLGGAVPVAGDELGGAAADVGDEHARSSRPRVAPA